MVSPIKRPNGLRPRPLTAQQERFCVLIVEGSTARAAYCEAYGRTLGDNGRKAKDGKPLNAVANSIDASASNLLKKFKIATRIAALRAEIAAASRVTLLSLTRLLLETQRLATTDKQHAAAASAVATIAKMHGLLIDRHQIDAVVRKPSASPDAPDDMSEADWLTTYGGSVIDVLPAPSQGAGSASGDPPDDPPPDVLDALPAPSQGASGDADAQAFAELFGTPARGPGEVPKPPPSTSGAANARPPQAKARKPGSRNIKGLGRRARAKVEGSAPRAKKSMKSKG